MNSVTRINLMVCFIVFCVGILSNSILAEELILTSNKVVHTSEAGYNYNYGADSTLKVGSDVNTLNLYGWIQFDLSALPQGVTITYASLKLQIKQNNLKEKSIFWARMADATWDEYSIKWYNQPGVITSPSNAAEIPATSSGNEYWNVTWHVREWYANPQNNFGLCIYYNNTNLLVTNNIWFYSDDESTASYRPQLTIRYTYFTSYPPIAEHNGPYYANIGNNISFDASGSIDPDGGEIQSYSWDFGDGYGTTGETVTHSYFTVGEYTVSLVVTDDEGDQDMVTTTAYITNHIVPVADAGGPYGAIVNNAVSFNGDGSYDPDGGNIVSYAWNFGDGGQGSGKYPTHSYSTAGSYTVNLTVTDDEGQTASTSAGVTISESPKPVAVIDGPSESEINENITFDASNSQYASGYEILTYEWDFGDGGTATGQTVQHTYTEENSYTVTLTVTDNHGQQDTETLNITVDLPTWNISGQIKFQKQVLVLGQENDVSLFLNGAKVQLQKRISILSTIIFWKDIAGMTAYTKENGSFELPACQMEKLDNLRLRITAENSDSSIKLYKNYNGKYIEEKDAVNGEMIDVWSCDINIKEEFSEYVVSNEILFNAFYIFSDLVEMDNKFINFTKNYTYTWQDFKQSIAAYWSPQSPIRSYESFFLKEKNQIWYHKDIYSLSSGFLERHITHEYGHYIAYHIGIHSENYSQNHDIRGYAENLADFFSSVGRYIASDLDGYMNLSWIPGDSLQDFELNEKFQYLPGNFTNIRDACNAVTCDWLDNTSDLLPKNNVCDTSRIEFKKIWNFLIEQKPQTMQEFWAKWDKTDYNESYAMYEILEATGFPVTSPQTICVADSKVYTYNDSLLYIASGSVSTERSFITGLTALAATQNLKSKIYEFLPADQNGDITFAQPANLTLPYTDAGLSSAQESGLAIYYYNETSKVWESVGGNVDTSAKTVSTYISHFSKYTVGLPELASVPAQPTGFSVTNTVAENGELLVSWTPNTEQDLLGYNLEIEIDGYDDTTSIALDNQSSSYTMYSVSPGSYTISLSAYDNDSNVSQSAEQSIVISDTDNDTLPDIWEYNWFGNLNYTAQDDSLLDNDGIVNEAEYAFGINPMSNDTDNDGLSDYEELYVTSTDPGCADLDNDGLNDRQEKYLFGTDPANPDSDSDGYSDYEEAIVCNTNPLRVSHIEKDNFAVVDSSKWFFGAYENANLNPSQDAALKYVSTSPDPAYATYIWQSFSLRQSLSWSVMLDLQLPFVQSAQGEGYYVLLLSFLPASSDYETYPDHLLGYEFFNSSNLAAGTNSLAAYNDDFGNVTGNVDNLFTTSEYISIKVTWSPLVRKMLFYYDVTGTRTNWVYYTSLDIADWNIGDQDNIAMTLAGQSYNRIITANDDMGFKNFVLTSQPGDDFIWETDTVIGTTGEDYAYRQAVSGCNGSFMIGWVDTANHTYVQSINGNGALSGTPVLITQNNDYTEGYPALGTDGQNYLLVRSSRRDDGSDPQNKDIGLYGTILSAAGVLLCPEVRIDTASNTYTEPVIASNGDNYLVVWVENDGGNSGIFGQIIDNDGTKITDSFLVNTYTTDLQIYPAVASDDENYLVAWRSDGQDGNIYGIYGQHVANNGSFIGNEFFIAGCAHSSNPSFTQYQFKPAIASNGINYFVGWRGTDLKDINGTIYTVLEMYGCLVSKSGTLILPSFKVREFDMFSTTSTSSAILEPGVVSDGYNYFLAWSYGPATDENDDGFSRISVKLIGCDGSKMGIENRKRYYGNTIDSFVMPAFNGNTFLVSWIDETSDDTLYYTVLNPMESSSLNDSDNDGLSDRLENIYNTNPLYSDSDNDGLDDYKEVCYDGNPYMYNPYSVRQGYGTDTDASVSDTDNDGMTDGFEVQYGLNPLSADDRFMDLDNDSFLNLEEFLNNTDPSDQNSLPEFFDYHFEVTRIRYNHDQPQTNGWVFVSVTPPSGKALSFVELVFPDGSIINSPVSLSIDEKCTIDETDIFEVDTVPLSEIESAFPDGIYIINIQCTDGSSYSKIVTKSFGSYPDFPDVRYPVDQEDDVYLTPTIDWAVGDIDWIDIIETGSEEEVFLTIVPYGVTSYTIPAGILEPNMSYVMTVDRNDRDVRKRGSATIIRFTTTDDTAHTVSQPGIPAGPEHGYHEIPYTFMTGNADCNQEHPVEYSFQWGDNTSSDYSTEKTAAHSWQSVGTYNIIVTARCTIDSTVVSVNSDSMTIVIQHNDMDNDGLTVLEEDFYGTDPNNPDTDHDGMSDGDEVKVYMEPDNADSVFCILDCTVDTESSGLKLTWQGSISNPEIEYKIFWCDDLLTPWSEAIVNQDSINDNNGIRTWLDEGDNDSSIPRSVPNETSFRLYKVIVE